MLFKNLVSLAKSGNCLGNLAFALSDGDATCDAGHREAAYLLNTYIQCPRDLLFDPALLDGDDCTRPLSILELGSGTGIVSATLAEHLTERDATLVVTDLPEVCPLLEQNLQQHISRRSAPRVLVRPLSWGNSQEAMNIAVELGCLSSNSTATSGSQHLTHIICSDLVSGHLDKQSIICVLCLFPTASPAFSSRRDGDAFDTVCLAFVLISATHLRGICRFISSSFLPRS